MGLHVKCKELLFGNILVPTGDLGILYYFWREAYNLSFIVSLKFWLEMYLFSMRYEDVFQVVPILYMDSKHSLLSPILKFGNDHDWAKRFLCGQKCSILYFSEHSRLKKESYEINAASKYYLLSKIIMPLLNAPFLSNLKKPLSIRARQNIQLKIEVYLHTSRIIFSQEVVHEALLWKRGQTLSGNGLRLWVSLSYNYFVTARLMWFA